MRKNAYPPQANRFYSMKSALAANAHHAFDFPCRFFVSLLFLLLLVVVFFSSATGTDIGNGQIETKTMIYKRNKDEIEEESEKNQTQTIISANRTLSKLN